MRGLVVKIAVAVFLGIVCSFPASAQAPNISGKWVIQMPGRGGQMQNTYVILNQYGNRVTGSLGARIGGGGSGSPTNTEIIDGKVDGNTVSFYVWRGSDQPVKQSYKGTIAGDQIKFTVSTPPITNGGFGGGGRGPGGAQGAAGAQGTTGTQGQAAQGAQ